MPKVVKSNQLLKAALNFYQFEVAYENSLLDLDSQIFKNVGSVDLQEALKQYPRYLINSPIITHDLLIRE